MSSKIAIILVNYNKYQVTFECVESLIKMNPDNYCVYIVDNGSQNDSAAKLKEREAELGYKLIVSDENLGFAGGNNIGIKRALKDGCDYVMLLNNDTEVDADFLDNIKSVATKDNVVVPKIYYYSKPDVLWYAGGIINWKSGDTRHVGAGEKDNGQYDGNRQTDFASGCCLMMHRNIVDKVGLLDESYFMYYEDTDYCARLKKAGVPIVFNSDAKVWHKVGSSNDGEYSKFMAYYMAKNRLKFVHKYAGKFNYFVCLIRTFCSGIKGYLVNKNSKVSIRAERDYLKELRKHKREGQ